VKSPWVVRDDCAVLSVSCLVSVTGRTWSVAFPSQTGILGRMLGKPDPKPAFRNEMTGFSKARRFQRDQLAIIDFYNVDAGLSI
jgi:hypothetical protein